MKKRLLSLALTLAMLLSMSAALGTTVFADGTVTEIGTYAQLVAWAKNPTTDAKLTANIVANEGFDPMTSTAQPANVWSRNALNGRKLDGQNHTIEGLYMARGFINQLKDSEISNITFKNCYSYADSNQAGLIAPYFDGTVTLRNVHIVDSVVDAKSVSGTTKNIGGFIGDAYTQDSVLTVENCSISGKVGSESVSVAGTDQVGGLIGRISYNGGKMQVTNFVNNAKVTSNYYVGGVIGYVPWGKTLAITFNGVQNNGAVEGKSAIGGMIGRDEGYGIQTFVNCQNNAKIQGASHTGGMVGIFKGTSISFDSCVNFADITSTGGPAAGLLGYAEGITLPAGQIYVATIKNCYNKGNINSTDHAGGLFGYFNYPVYMEDCLNAGDVVSSGSNKRVGSLIGSNQNSPTSVYKHCLAVSKAQSSKDMAGAMLGDITFTSVSDTTASNYTYVTIEDCYYVSGMVYNGTAKYNDYGFVISNLDSNGKKNGNVRLIYGGTTKDIVGGVVNASTSWANGVKAYNAPLNELAMVASAEIFNGIDGAILLSQKGFDFGSEWHVTNGLPVPTVLALEKGTIDQTTPVVYKGYQMKLDGTSIRLVAGLNDVAYVNMGYEIKVLEKGAVKAPATAPETTTVYTQLNAFASEDDANPDSIKAEDLDCAYLSAVSINNFPAEKDATIIVTPYVTNADDSKTYGTSIALIIVDGVVTFQYVI